MMMTIIAITTKLYSWKIIYLKVLQVATSVVTKAKQIASYPITILLLIIIINRRNLNWNQRLFLLFLLCCKKNKKNPNINKIDNLLLLSLFDCNLFQCIHCIITGGHHGTNLSLGYKFSCIKFNGNIVYFTNDNVNQNGNDSDINNNYDNGIQTRRRRKVRRRLSNKSIDCTGFSFSSNYKLLHYCQMIIIITTTIESFIHFCKCLLQIEARTKKSLSHNHPELFAYLDMCHLCSCDQFCDNCDISTIFSEIFLIKTLSRRRNYKENNQNASIIFKLQHIDNFPATNVANLKLFETTRENFPIFSPHCNICYRQNFRFQSISVLTTASVIISTVQIFDNPCGNSCSRTYPPTTIDQTAQSNLLLLSVLIVNFLMGQTSASSCCQRSSKIYFCSAILPHPFHCFHQSCRSCLIIVVVSFSDRLLYSVLYGDDNILCGQHSQNADCPFASNNNQDKISGKSFLQLHQWWLSDATNTNNNELTKFVSISTKNVDIIFFCLFRQVDCSNNNNNKNNNKKKESIYYVKNNKPNNNDYFDSNDFFQHRHCIAFFFFFFSNVVELKPNLNNKNIQIMNMTTTTTTTMIIFQTCHHQVASFTSFDLSLKIYLSFNSKNNSIPTIAGSHHEEAEELLNFCTVVNYYDDENKDKYNFQCKEFILNKSNDYYDYCDYCGFESYCELSIIITRRRRQPDDDDDDDNIHHASLSLLSSCNYLQSKVCLNCRNQSHRRRRRRCATAICLDFFLDRFYSFPSASSLDSIVIIIINIVAVVIIIVVAIIALILPTPSSMLPLLLLKSMKMMRLLMEQKSLVPLLANQRSSRCSDTSTTSSRHQWMMRSNSSPHHLLLMTIQRMLLLLLCCLLLLLLLLMVDCRLAGYTNWEYDAAFATITIMTVSLALALDTTNRTNAKVMRNVVKNANSTNDATSNTTTTILDAKDDDADNNGNNNTDDDDDDDDTNENNNSKINSEAKPKPLYAMNINELAMILWIVRLLLTMAKTPVKQSLVVLDEPTLSLSSNTKTKTNTKIWHHSVLVLATIGSKVKFTFISISTTTTTTTTPTTIAVIVIIAVCQKKNMQIRQTIVFLQIWLLSSCYFSTKSKANFAQSELPLVQLGPFVTTTNTRIRINVSKSIRKSNPRNLSKIIYSCCCLYIFSYSNNIIRTLLLLLLLLMPKYNNKSIIISLDTTNEINRLNNKRLFQQKDKFHGEVEEESSKNSNCLFAVKEDDDDLFAKFSNAKIWQIPMPKLEQKQQQQWKIINYSNFKYQILLNLIFKFYNLLLTSFLSYCYNKFCQLMYLTIVRLFIVPMSSLIIIGFKLNQKIFNKSKFIEYCANYFWLCNHCLVLIFFYEKN